METPKYPPMILPLGQPRGPACQGATSQGSQGAGEAGTHQAGSRLSSAADAWSGSYAATELRLPILKGVLDRCYFRQFW